MTLTPPYRIRPLDGQAEHDALGARITAWRRERRLPSASIRPILDALRDEREMAVLVDTDNDAFVGCLQLHRAPLPTPPWTTAEDAQPTLVLSCAATAPGAGYRLGWLLTTWARHYAALCGHTRVACAVPLSSDHDTTAQRLLSHLVDGCGWDHLRTADTATGTAALLTAAACRTEGLDAFLATKVPVQPAERETVS
ncbi:hypothetical protein [Streptomyces sp. NPDC055912]|uniref:hypothetical protein n=1 Tax=Streptomyces sp. NPDC055912 TaxID=3345660 RepID=UPI0035DC924D